MTALLIVYRLVLQRSAGPDIPTRWPRRVGRGYESRIPQQLPTGTFSPAVRLPVGEEWHRQCEGFGDHETTGHAAQRLDGGESPRRGVWHTRPAARTTYRTAQGLGSSVGLRSVTRD